MKEAIEYSYGCAKVTFSSEKEADKERLRIARAMAALYPILQRTGRVVTIMFNIAYTSSVRNSLEGLY